MTRCERGVEARIMESSRMPADSPLARIARITCREGDR